MEKKVMDESIRLQKFLAEAGIASRRKCEEYILEGKVKVNGVVITQMGNRVDPENDKVLHLFLEETDDGWRLVDEDGSDELSILIPLNLRDDLENGNVITELCKISGTCKSAGA